MVFKDFAEARITFIKLPNRLSIPSKRLFKKRATCQISLFLTPFDHVTKSSFCLFPVNFAVEVERCLSLRFYRQRYSDAF